MYSFVIVLWVLTDGWLYYQAFDYIAVIEVKNGSHFFVSLTGSLNAESFAQSYQPVTVSASGARGRIPSMTEKCDMGLVMGRSTSLSSSPSTSTHGSSHYPVPPPPMGHLSGGDSSSSSSSFSSLTGIGQPHSATGSTSDKRSRSGSILFGGQALTLPPVSSSARGINNSELTSPPNSARDRSGTRSRASSTASIVFSPSRNNSTTNFYDHTAKSSATSSGRSRWVLTLEGHSVITRYWITFYCYLCFIVATTDQHR